MEGGTYEPTKAAKEPNHSAAESFLVPNRVAQTRNTGILREAASVHGSDCGQLPSLL